MPVKNADTKMTTQQLGKRVGDLENDVKSLGKSVGELATVTAGVQQQVNMLSQGQDSQNEKLDRLLARNAGAESVKGMIPIGYVTWGFGALLTMIGLFFTASIIVAGIIIYAVNSGDKINNLRTQQVADNVKENSEFIEHLRDNGTFTDSDFQRFEDTEFLPLREKVNGQNKKKER